MQGGAGCHESVGFWAVVGKGEQATFYIVVCPFYFLGGGGDGKYDSKSRIY